MEISGCWNLYFYTFLIFLMSTRKKCYRSKTDIWNINWKQTCCDISNGWCWVVEIGCLLLASFYFFPNFQGKKLRNRICAVFPNLIHSLLIDDQCYARHQARWKEKPLCSPPGDQEAPWGLAGWLFKRSWNSGKSLFTPQCPLEWGPENQPCWEVRG